MKVKLIVDGGNMKPGPAVSQQLGPMGINLGKVIEDVNKETSGFKGTKVPVELDIDPKTKTYTIEVFSPPMAELIKKELKIEKASGEAGKTKAGNIAFETLLSIAKTKLASLPAKDLRAAIKMAIGSCVSLGVLIDSKEPKLVNQEVDEGIYDNTIKDEVTSPSEEKKKELEAFWKDLSAQQEKTKKAAEEAKAAAEAAKSEEAAKAAPTEGEAATATEGEAKKEDAGKTEEKKEDKGKKEGKKEDKKKK